MRRSKPVFALAYDFDGTLAPGNMQEHSFIPALGIRNAKDFWTRSNEHAAASQGDPIFSTCGACWKAPTTKMLK